MKGIEADLTIQTAHLVPNLLKVHAYGLYELAQECALRLHVSIHEVLPVLNSSLQELVSCNRLRYDRQHNCVSLQELPAPG